MITKYCLFRSDTNRYCYSKYSDTHLVQDAKTFDNELSAEQFNKELQTKYDRIIAVEGVLIRDSTKPRSDPVFIVGDKCVVSRYVDEYHQVYDCDNCGTRKFTVSVFDGDQTKLYNVYHEWMWSKDISDLDDPGWFVDNQFVITEVTDTIKPYQSVLSHRNWLFV